MKIVIGVHELNIRGGTHKQVLRLAQYLKARGHDVCLLTRIKDLSKTYPEFADFDTILDEAISQNRWHKMIRTIKICKEISENADVFNAHDGNMERYIIICRLLHPKKPIVWQINDLHACFLCGVSENDKGVHSLREKWVALLAARCCNRITVNVTKNKERVEYFLHKKAEVLYCGVDVNQQLIKHKYVISDKKVRVLSSGVFFPYRNYETLVNVIDRLRHQYDIHLDIIGSTTLNQWYANSIAQMICDKGLSENITIHGQVDENKYNELHNNADLFAFINVNQSWGLAVFEAMSCGLPVIVSNSVGATELLRNGVDSVFVNPMNVDEICERITELIENRKMYNQISENANNIVKQYSWDELYSKKMETMFIDLCE